MKYGLDTNVLARWVLADDPVQHSAVHAKFLQCHANGSQVTVHVTVLLELEWVLRSAAQLKKSQVISVFKALLDTKDLIIQDEAVFVQAIYFYEDNKADFAECLFLAQYLSNGCDSMLSFDQQAQLLHAIEPV